MFIEKDDGVERLVLCRGSDVFIDGKMCEKRLDLCTAHLAGMFEVVEADEAADPVDVGMFSGKSVVAASKRIADAVEQFNLWLGHAVLRLNLRPGCAMLCWLGVIWCRIARYPPSERVFELVFSIIPYTSAF